MQEKVNKIYNANNLDILRTLPDNSVDALITDFPYGLQDIDALKLMQENTNNTRGFMGCVWDRLPTTEFLIECLRVLKEGSWLISTFTPRQDLNCVMKYRLLEAGFDISFSPLYWNYLSGFPKANNVQKRLIKDLTNGKERTINSCKNILEDLWLSQEFVLYATEQFNLINAREKNITPQEGFVHSPALESIPFKRLLQLQEQEKYIIIAKNAEMLLPHNTEQYFVGRNVSQAIERITVNYKPINAMVVEKMLCDTSQKICKTDVTIFIVVENVKVNTQQFYCDVKLVKLNLEEHKVSKENLIESFVVKNVKTKVLEKIIHKIKGEEVWKIENGKNKFLLKEILNVLYVEVIENLKPTILKQLMTTQNYDTTLITDFVSVINVIITKSTMECLISNTVNILERRQEEKQNYKALEGIYGGFQPKPSTEEILCVMKPYKAKSQTDQALKWYYERKELLDKGIREEDLCFYTTQNHAGSRLDKGRIPTSQEDYSAMVKKRDSFKNTATIHYGNVEMENMSLTPTNGRFPANLLTGSNPIDIEEILTSHSNGIETPYLTSFLDYIGITLEDFINLTQEELIAIVERIENPLDVGRETKAVGGLAYNFKNSNNENSTKITKNIKSGIHFNDKGDLSRYFSLSQWTKKNHPALAKLITKTLQVEADAKKISPHLFCSKPSKEEANKGLEGFEEKVNEKIGQLSNSIRENGSIRTSPLQQNTHPTKKPISLFAYLIEIFSNEYDIILDPFCGSGVTPISAVLTNRKYIGIDLEEEYCLIAEARVKYWQEEMEANSGIVQSFDYREVKPTDEIEDSQPSLF